ncbi:hypothetical protein Ddye_005970 [Dipteronia dyeriana]|uniref:Uncharacterized protein n=1 Tax=Dipteronia dyeriana TaxID=168575 RepID=A0AAD9XHI4_9ROSI|nr:hypothetical protein Ddye_005970 [Dipteronia dyeriana]
MKKELEEARYVEVVANEAMKESNEKLVGLEEKVARLRASLKSSKDKLSQTDVTLTDVLERFDMATDEAIIRTRGHNDSKNPDKDVEVWEQWKELKALDAYNNKDEDNEKEVGAELEKEVMGSNARDNLEGATHEQDI